MSTFPPLPPGWAEQIAPAARALRRARPARQRDARAALWLLLHAALFAALRAQAGKVLAVSREDLEDLASAKALELLLRAEEGAWDLSSRLPREVAGYIAKVARHGLIDLARRRGRECPGPDDPDAWSHALSDGALAAGPEDHLAAQEFIGALRDCVAGLSGRARDVWFRRAFLERPSREIAVRLGLRESHVDVIVQRAREALRQCMQGKGHRDADARPGAFVEIWASLPAGFQGSDAEGASEDAR